MKRIIGGVISVIIGGTIYAVSESDIAKHFSENTGMSQEQAQEYINNIPEGELDSFSKIGEDLINDGNELLNGAKEIDCYNYNYEWETSSLSCQSGKKQLETIGEDEIKLGKCYQSLDDDLGDSAVPKTKECISDIDKVNADYEYPIVNVIMDDTEVTDWKNTNYYNKSLLQAAVESK